MGMELPKKIKPPRVSATTQRGISTSRTACKAHVPRSVAEDGRVEQLKLRPGHRNIEDFHEMYSSETRACHEEGSGRGTTFRDFLKLPGHTKLVLWPEIRAAMAQHALDRQAWRDSI
eukprot:365071-Chlamydomonas_euryale.AAC.8